jgi:hypothetical protein
MKLLPIHQLEIFVQWGTKSAFGYMSMIPVEQRKAYLEAIINRLVEQVEKMKVQRG